MIDITRFLLPEEKDRAVASYTHNNSLSKYDLNKQMIFTLLRSFKDIHGNLLVKLNFVVPLGDIRWPVWSHGCKLGLIVRKLRKSFSDDELDDDEMKELEDLGMVWDVEEYINQLTVYAFEIYQEIYGDLNLPTQFIIPSNTQNLPANPSLPTRRKQRKKSWPAELWGEDLGAIATAIRSNEAAYRPILPTLRSIGFLFPRKTGRGHSNSTSHGGHRYEGIEDVLAAYKEIHGNLQIPQRYVIPDEDDRYPEAYRGRSLGSICHNIRYNQLYRDQKEDLIALGYEEFERKSDRMSSSLTIHTTTHTNTTNTTTTPSYPTSSRNGRGNFEDCKAALLVYKSLYGHLFVPYDYLIPKDETHYAETYRGRALGSIVRNIIYNNQYKDYREELAALGIEYNKVVYKEQCKIQQGIHVRVEQEQARLQALMGGSTGAGAGGNFLSLPAVPTTSSSSSSSQIIMTGGGGGGPGGGGPGGVPGKSSKGPGRPPNTAVTGGGTPTTRATFPEVYEGLKCYKRVVGDLRIPQKFVVPRHSPDWPKSLAGLKLGTILQNIRYNKTFAKNEQEIRALGITRKVLVGTGNSGNGNSAGSSSSGGGGGRPLLQRQAKQQSESESDDVEEEGEDEEEVGEDGEEMEVDEESSEEPVSVDEE